MCNLYEYEMTAEDERLLAEHFKLVGKAFAEAMRGTNAARQVYPNYEAPVVVSIDGKPVVRTMRWGFPPPPFIKTKATVQNVRHVAKGYWKPYLELGQRCLVPATAFSEFDHALKLPRWFKRPDGAPFFFAGIWRPWTGDRGTKAKPNVGDHVLFAFLTTEPNAVVKPIHPKAMPVLLRTAEEIETWLAGSNDDALALQKPAPDDAIVLLPPKKKAA